MSTLYTQLIYWYALEYADLALGRNVLRTVLLFHYITCLLESS